MNIPLSPTYTNLMDISINMVTKNWVGFVQLHLQHLKRDSFALLCGQRAFITKMEDGEQLIGKVKKDLELITKIWNMHLHLKGDTLCDNTTHSILKTPMQDCYYEGRQSGDTFPHQDGRHKEFAFIMLTMEETQYELPTNGLAHSSNKLKVNTIKGRNLTTHWNWELVSF